MQSRSQLVGRSKLGSEKLVESTCHQLKQPGAVFLKILRVAPSGQILRKFLNHDVFFEFPLKVKNRF